MRKVFWTSLTIALLLFAPAGVHAQQYEPSVGQEGKDVIWVPTPEALVQAMLDMADVTPEDFVMDLGSGDGRIVIAAAKRGAQAVGIEYNADMVELSKRNAEKAGVSAKANFMKADLFETDFSKATVITMYLLPSLNLKLRPTLLDLKPGTRIVAHAFSMAEWQCDRSVERDFRTAYLWIVPAKVAGNWAVTLNPGSAELTLTQNFQTFEGTLSLNGNSNAIKDTKLSGSHISFTCGDSEYTGTVSGNKMEGSVKTKGRALQWSAVLK